jgi:uncharacterized protein (DUF736 family)
VQQEALIVGRQRRITGKREGRYLSVKLDDPNFPFVDRRKLAANNRLDVEWTSEKGGVRLTD